MGSFTAGAGTSYLLSSTAPVPSGTANGVLYLNGTKVPTTSSALTFDGTNFGVGTTSPTLLFQVGSRGGMDSTGIFRWGSALTGNNRGVLSWDTNIASIGAPQNLVFCANSETTERMRIDTSGNLGLGVTPSAWSGLASALQVQRASIITSSAAAVDTYFSSNAFYDGSWKYILSAPATQYMQNVSGDHRWRVAASGTAGNPISFTQAMTLDASGNLGIGTTSTTTRVTSDYGPSAAINVSTPNSTTSLTLGASDPGTVAVGFGTLLQFRGIIGRGAVAAIGGVYGGTNKDGDLSLVFYRNSGSGTIAEAARIDQNGNVVLNTGAIATNATNGFFYVAGCGGTPTGVPNPFTGRVPIVVDTTNNKLYFYSGGAWRDAGP